VTICTTCGAEAAPGQRFCGQCGSPLARPCPACGAENLPDNRFCGSCGTALGGGSAVSQVPVASVSERRLVSVLFADLVGFTTLSEHRDPEEVRDLLSRYFERCRSLIERYGGTVEKFIGDAVMAVWGSPVAREDDAERAVRAALALTRAVSGMADEVGMAQLELRAGVLTGPAAVELGAEGEGMVLGDAVNTASRLQSIAQPGTVLVDDVTRRASEAAIEYEDAGEHAVKGRDQPVRAWTALRVVAGVGGARRGAGLEARFVGRDAELQSVIDMAEHTVAHGAARLVTVTAEAGLGKSRLLWELFKYIDGISALRWWHQGRCLAYGEGVSYWALAEMVRARAQIAEEDSTADERRKLQATIERFVADERERRLVEPRLAQLLGLEERSAGEAADLFSGWRLFFERMADAAPVILAFEDLQWADSGLLDFIDYMLEWSAGYPIFILALGRPELEGRRPGRGTSIRLGPLAPDSMRGLLDGLVPGLPPDLTERILDRADGVPLYAVETVRMLLDRGMLAQEGNRYVLTRAIEDLEVPETLQALVAARLDNLEPAERALLQNAAVLGISFTPAALQAVSGRPAAEVVAGLEALVAKQALGVDDDVRSAEQGQYHFLQGLLRTIALGTLARRDRKARHLAAAEHLRTHWGDAPEIAEVLASHYLDAVAAEPDADDADAIRGRARETLVAAGRRAVSMALGAEARAHFERAASLADDESERARLLADAGVAAARTADRVGARRLLTDSIAVLEDSGLYRDAALTRVRLAEALIYDNRLQQASEVMDGAREPLDDPVAQAELAARRAQIAFLRGDYARALQDAELALSIADPRGLHAVFAEAAVTKANALYYVDRRTESEALLAAGLRVALEADVSEQALRAFYNLAELTSLGGSQSEALTLIENGLALARERGNRVWERELLAQGVGIRLLAGEWDSAMATIEALRSSGESESSRVASAYAPAVLLARGQPAVMPALGGGPAEPSEWQELAVLEGVSRALGLCATAEDRDEGSRLLESVAGPLNVMNSAAKAVYFADVVQTLLDCGRVDVVRELLGVNNARPPRVIAGHLHQARALLHVRAGAVAEAEGEFRLAHQDLAEAGLPFHRARCELALGQLLADTGRGEEAEPLVAQARETFTRLGATAWLTRHPSPVG
jgi:class 3 adenylate cyclase/tetratricopeptide (TPR) repeat protein